ncbi:DUF4129 domain-containing protein [Streptomyces sp. NPDC050560]|uniref:DUF4129 domain-containing protein n=1 Tax=Streptomyces sp. NPDC050560 TaxID=3365630 RepID=UPI00379EADB2
MRITGALLTAARATGDDGPPLTVLRREGRDAARHELSKGMYHKNDPGLIQRALNRLWDWLGDLLGSAAGATPGGGVGLTVIVLALLALAAALWWRLGTPRRTPQAPPALFDDSPRTAAQHRASAEAHAAQGHWNQAVQERMRALVRALEERALLDPRPGRTADEAAAEAARPMPGHAPRLTAAARDFDDVTYGGRQAGRAAYERLAALDADLEQTRPDLAAASAPAWERPV